MHDGPYHDKTKLATNDHYLCDEVTDMETQPVCTGRRRRQRRKRSFIGVVVRNAHWNWRGGKDNQKEKTHQPSFPQSNFMASSITLLRSTTASCGVNIRFTVFLPALVIRAFIVR